MLEIQPSDVSYFLFFGLNLIKKKGLRNI